MKTANPNRTVRSILFSVVAAAGVLAAAPAAHASLGGGIILPRPPGPGAFPPANIFRSFNCNELHGNQDLITPGSVHIGSEDYSLPQFGVRCYAHGAAWIGSGWMGADVFASGDAIVGGADYGFSGWARSDYGPDGARAWYRVVLNGDVLADQFMTNPLAISDGTGYYNDFPLHTGTDVGPDYAHLHLGADGSLNLYADAGFTVGRFAARAHADAGMRGYVDASGAIQVWDPVNKTWRQVTGIGQSHVDVVDDGMDASAGLGLRRTDAGWKACASYGLTNAANKLLEGTLVNGYFSLPYIDKSPFNLNLGSEVCTPEIGG